MTDPVRAQTGRNEPPLAERWFGKKLTARNLAPRHEGARQRLDELRGMINRRRLSERSRLIRIGETHSPRNYWKHGNADRRHHHSSTVHGASADWTRAFAMIGILRFFCGHALSRRIANCVRHEIASKDEKCEQRGHAAKGCVAENSHRSRLNNDN